MAKTYSWERRLSWGVAAVQALRLLWAERQARLLRPVLPKPEPDEGRRYPTVSAVVPARNEASNIAACLEGLRAQRYPGLEIVVVDDRSDDDTAAIVRRIAAEDSRVRLVEGGTLPPGWIGKCWALHQGSQVAGGEWLLFVDADTRLFAGAITAAVEDAERQAAAVYSVLTNQELPTVWERVVQPGVFAMLAEALPIELVNDPRLPQIAIANGQFLMARRDAYDAIGGHAAIRNEIGEDAQFARRAKQLGWRFWLGDGRLLATTRMYTSPGALWEGWTKNLHVGVQLLPWLVPPGTAYSAFTLAAPYWSLYRGFRQRSASLFGAGAIQLLAMIALRRRVDHTFGVPPIYALTQPLGQLAFLVLLGASYYKVVTGRGVTWKGRRYYTAVGAGASADATPHSVIAHST